MRLVSSAENKSNLESQALRVEQYCIARGYQIVGIVKEVGSGVNDNRKKLIKMLQRDDYHLIVCEHKDRLTRVGFNYIKVLLNQTGKDVEVINEAREEKEDLMSDQKNSKFKIQNSKFKRVQAPTINL